MNGISDTPVGYHIHPYDVQGIGVIGGHAFPVLFHTVMPLLDAYWQSGETIVSVLSFSYGDSASFPFGINPNLIPPNESIRHFDGSAVKKVGKFPLAPVKAGNGDENADSGGIIGKKISALTGSNMKGKLPLGQRPGVAGFDPPSSLEDLHDAIYDAGLFEAGDLDTFNDFWIGGSGHTTASSNSWIETFLFNGFGKPFFGRRHYIMRLWTCARDDFNI